MKLGANKIFKVAIKDSVKNTPSLETDCKATMLKPAISPSELLAQFIGVMKNIETGAPYQWDKNHCAQYLHYQKALETSSQKIDRTILLDMADELLDAGKTLSKYQTTAHVVAFDGGSHSFEHYDRHCQSLSA